MTGSAAPMRPIVKFKMRVCKHCKVKFQPVRSDAAYCQDLCRSAANRTRKKIDAVAVAKEAAADRQRVFAKRKAEALEVIDQFDRYQSIAGMLHQKAKVSGSNVKFMATKIGILALEMCPGALKSASDCLVWLILCREIKTRSDDRELRALLSIPSLAGPYIAREAENEFRAIIEQGPPIDVSLFVYDVTPARVEQFNRVVDNKWDGGLRLEILNDEVKPSSDENDRDGARDSDNIYVHDSGDSDDGEYDPRDEPDLNEPAMPDDAGVMDHADPFWR